MAAERTVECPDCGAERVTRAQPRTRLRCRSCDAHFLNPPLDPDPPPEPSGGAGSPEGDNLDLGPPVERVESVEFPAAPVAPDAVARSRETSQDMEEMSIAEDKSRSTDRRQPSQDLDDLDLADPPGSSDPAPVADPAPGSSAPAQGGGSDTEPPQPPPTPAGRRRRRRRYGRW